MGDDLLSDYDKHRRRSVIGQVVDILRRRGVTHKKIHTPFVVSPVFVPHTMTWCGLNISVDTVEHRSELHTFPDIASWERSLEHWKMDEVMHIYSAEEYYEPRSYLFDCPLDALAAWMSIDQLHLRYFVTRRGTD